MFFASFAKSRYCLKKKSSKNIEKYWSKIYFGIFSKKYFRNFWKSWSNFVWKNFAEIFFHTKLLHDFQKFRRRNFQNIFSTRIFQYFSMIFFANHIYSSRTMRKTRFQQLLINSTTVLESAFIFFPKWKETIDIGDDLLKSSELRPNTMRIRVRLKQKTHCAWR